MCELLALSARHPATVDVSLDEFASHAAPTNKNRDGWGIAYYEDYDARLVKEAGPAASSDWVHFIESHHLRSRLVVAHIRHAIESILLVVLPSFSPAAILRVIMLHWLRERRRRRLLAAPFPAGWEAYIRRNVAHYRWLDARERQHLRDLVQAFVAEKHWEGCGGLALSDEIRVTIAAQACLLVLELPHQLYRNVQSILVYPSTVVAPRRQLGTFEVPLKPVEEPLPILGQAQLRGPVILVWDAVKRTGRHPEIGHNVVYHEFAHKLDMLDGRADGTPPLHGRAEYQRWARVCSREYRALREQAERGRHCLLDAYGSASEAEFFAVATEQFFDHPVALRRHHRELYTVLQAFYRQDPAARVAARPA